MVKALFVLLLLLVSMTIASAKEMNGFDVSNSLIPTEHIKQGGPPKDGIPAIDKPHYVSAEEAGFLQGNDFVLGFELEGQAFAYPRYILNWHELINDQVNGKPFLISYCPLCGTGMAFSSSVDGKHLMFGVSGLLFNSDVLFFDRESESLWSQLEKKAISGKLVGTELEQLYLEHTTWDNWKVQHPQTKVLSEQQGFTRSYRRDPYSGYETSSQLFFKTLRSAPKEFHTKERVMGVEINGAYKAYPYIELRKHGKLKFTDTIEGSDYIIHWDEATETAKIETVAGEKVVSTVAYWFAWYTFHPGTEIFRGKENQE